MFRKIKSSISAKLILASVIVEVVMLCLLLSNSVRLINQATFEHAKTHLTEIPPLLNTSLAPLLFQRDFASINDFLNDIIIDDEHGISYIVIQGDSGQLYGMKGKVDSKNLPKLNDILQNNIQMSIIHSEIPLILSGKQIGVVKFGISLKHLLESKNKLLYQGLLIAATEILLTILLLGLIGYMLTRHIGTLVANAKAMSMGDYTVAIETTGIDEIGQLSKSFNEMATKVQEQTNYLKESEEKYRSLFERESDAIFIFDPDTTNILDANEATSKMYGYSNEELIGMSCLELSTESKASASSIDTIREADKVNVSLRFHCKKDGNVFPVDISGYAITLGGKKLMYAVSKDISNRIKAEDAQRKSEEKYRRLIQNALVGIYQVTKEGRFIMVNQKMVEIFGYDSQEKFLADVDDIAKLYVHPEERPTILKEIDEKGFVADKEVEFIKRDGSVIWIKLFTTGFKNKENAFYEGLMQDITRHKMLEVKLQQSQKMESIGTLAGGIAHDFNNLLYPIVGMSELLLEDLPEDSLEYENAQEILKAGKRGSDLVKQILAFSRQSEHRLIPVRIQQVLKEVLRLSRSTIPSDVEIIQNIQKDCGMVMADPTQIHQIAMNLITNAYHALDQAGGRIEVNLEETGLNADDLVNSPLQAGRYAMLKVSDNGVGIDSAIVDKIFEPYFTTKEKGKGTGLGLAVVYGIVREYGGDLKVESEFGRTTFTVNIPIIAQLPKVDSGKKKGILQTGTEHILLVDDEGPIVKLEQQILERLGYKVTALTSSLDALDAFRTYPNAFDIAITDMTMPNMTGDQFAKELISIKPNLPVIICTGFSERIDEEKAKSIGIKGFLMKPVVKAKMVKMIRRVLDEAKKET